MFFRLGVAHHCPRRDADLQVLSSLPLLIFPLPMAASVGFEMAALPEVDEAVLMGVDHQIDVTSSAAVTSVWPSEGDIFLSAETDAAVAARSRLHVDLSLIEKQLHPRGRIYEEGTPVKKTPLEADVWALGK